MSFNTSFNTYFIEWLNIQWISIANQFLKSLKTTKFTCCNFLDISGP